MCMCFLHVDKYVQAAILSSPEESEGECPQLFFLLHGELNAGQPSLVEMVKEFFSEALFENTKSVINIPLSQTRSD